MPASPLSPSTKRFDLRVVVLRALFVLVGLELVYLFVANTLESPALRWAINTSDEEEVAYSALPGRARFATSSLRLQADADGRMSTQRSASREALQVSSHAEQLGLKAIGADEPARALAAQDPSSQKLNAWLELSAGPTRPALIPERLSPTLITVPSNRGRRPLRAATVEQLAAHGSIALQGERDQHGALQGSTRVQVSDLALRTSGLHISGNTQPVAQFYTDATRADTSGFDRVRLGLTESTIASPKGNSRPATASFESDDLAVRAKAQRWAQGAVEVDAERASELLPFVVDSPLLREMQQRLGLEDLKARTEFRVTDKHARFDLLQARSGDVTARGYMQRSERGPAGAFLVSTPVANVGLRVVSGEVQVQVFVSDRWLAGEPRGVTNTQQ